MDNCNRDRCCFRRGPSRAWHLKQPSRKQTMTGGVLVFLLILGAYVVGFVGWGSPRAGGGSVPIAKGTASCSVTIGCQVSVSFGITFSSTPQVWFPNLNPPSFSESILDDFCFVCPETGVGVTWSNMPSGSTPVEIFGDANYQHQVIL